MEDDSRKIRKLMDSQFMKEVLERIAAEILDLCPDPEKMVLMGMATRGIPLAERLRDHIVTKTGAKVDQGSLDTSFYRDDYHYRNSLRVPSLRFEGIPPDVEDRHVVLVDDVLFTGRTVRAAMDAITDLGRPRSIRLCVLVDRGCREFPICPDFVGESFQTSSLEEVRVSLLPGDGEDSVWLVEVEEKT